MSSSRATPLGVFLVAWGAFVALLAPDVAFRDSGEIGGAAVTLGIAHPTGFALDMLWMHAWTWLPLGSLALRASLGVAFAAAACVALVADVIAQLSEDRGAVVGALVGAVVLGSFSTFLGTATLIEVYSSSLFLVLVALRELVHERPRIGALAVVAGLAIGAHVTAWLGCGALFVIAALRSRAGAGPRLGAAFGGGALAVVVALVVALYLPLRSATDPAFDWGDPETLARWWEHLSASRIRSAYADAPSDLVGLLAQLGELWAFVPLVIFGLLRGAPRARVALLALALLDVAYGAFVNPMGIVDQQVGHVAGAALAVFAGVGAGELVARLARHRRASSVLLAGLALVVGVTQSSVHVDVDRDGADALLGGAGVLGALPPRAIYVCTSDDACASALFARYAVGERPDLDVVVAQHLWEPTERAKLRAIALGLGTDRPAEPTERARLAAAALIALASVRDRPVRFEEGEVFPFRGQLRAAEPGVVGLGTRSDLDAWRRFAEARRPRSRRGRETLSRLHEALGRTLLREGADAAARDAFSRSAIAAPWRAVAWTNLGVVAAGMGALDEAIVATELATRLDPARETAWLNLARYQAAQHPTLALDTLRRAEARGVWSDAMEELRRALVARP